MNNAFRVSCIQCIGDLNAQRERLRNIERFTVNLVAQRFSAKKLHHEEWMTRRLTYVVNGANIGMIERRGSVGLSLKAFPRRFRRKGLWKHFDGDIAKEPWVAGTIHFAHASLADGREDF